MAENKLNKQNEELQEENLDQAEGGCPVIYSDRFDAYRSGALGK